MESNSTELDDLLSCISELASSSGDLHRRADELCQWLSAFAGRPAGSLYANTVPLDRRLAMTEQIAQAIRALAPAANRFRRMEARALYAEGLTMAQLATVLGVSRQRVSALLRQGRDPR